MREKSLYTDPFYPECSVDKCTRTDKSKFRELCTRHGQQGCTIPYRLFVSFTFIDECVSDKRIEMAVKTNLA